MPDKASPELVAAYRVAAAASSPPRTSVRHTGVTSHFIDATHEALSAEQLGELLLLRQPLVGGIAAVVSHPVAHRLRRSGKMRNASSCTRSLSVVGTTVDVIEATDFASLVIRGNPRWCSLLQKEEGPEALYASESWRALLRAAPSPAFLAGAPMLHTSAYWARTRE